MGEGVRERVCMYVYARWYIVYDICYGFVLIKCLTFR